MSAAPQLRRLIAVALGAAAMFLAIYLVAVRTEPGQRADDAALHASERVPPRGRSGADKMLRTISLGSLLAGLAGLGGVAYVRRRPALVLLPALVVVASVAAAELLKHVILTRPVLVIDPILPQNSYPSGHTTVAVSIALAAVLVAPARLRALTALAAAAFAGGIGALVVTAGWHRPSDPLGAFALTLAVSALVLALLQARGRDAWPLTGEGIAAPEGARVAGRIERAALVAGVAVFFGSIVLASLRYGPQIDWTKPDAAFLASIAAIVAAAGLTVGALLRALSPEPAPPG